ncbi:MAG TPA: lytic transglycosylase domain-containing protein [Candidatus Acidoferrum sp.]|nr:lytic transglycosylase domain-containing protein [Candidatus Acidoferrum sp.]
MRKTSGFKRFKRTLWAVLLGAALLAAALLAARGLFPNDYRVTVEAAADRYGLSRELVYAVIWTESKFEPSAVSSAGAVGLMQLTPDTYAWLCEKRGEEPRDLFDPKTNIDYGCYNLSLLYARYESDWMAIAAYNAGRARVDEWLAGGLDKDGIPYKETRRFVTQVEAVKILYRLLY